jgi:hypothetical protein
MFCSLAASVYSPVLLQGSLRLVDLDEDEAPTAVMTLIRQCLSVTPEERPTARDIVDTLKGQLSVYSAGGAEFPTPRLSARIGTIFYHSCSRASTTTVVITDHCIRRPSVASLRYCSLYHYRSLVLTAGCCMWSRCRWLAGNYLWCV